jgi:CRISPR-associated protein Csx16
MSEGFFGSVNLIVTRHPGAIEWLERRGVDGRYIEHATGDEGEPGDSVYGPIPIDFAAKFLRRGLTVYFVALPGLSLDLRKGELSADQMDKAGATLLHVKAIEIEPA